MSRQLFSNFQMLRARMAQFLAGLVGVPVTVDIEFFLPELKRLPIRRGFYLSKSWLAQKDLHARNQSPDSVSKR